MRRRLLFQILTIRFGAERDNEAAAEGKSSGGCDCLFCGYAGDWRAAGDGTSGNCGARQIAVMGVDNTIYGEICKPQLSTLDNKLVEVSRNASGILLNALEKKVVSKRMMVCTEIIEREST